MSSFTRSSAISVSLRRTLLQTRQTRTLPTIQSRFYAQGGYGGSDGSPVGENPQDQGPSQSSDKEHPGAPPPKVGENSGSSPTKANQDGHTGTQASKKGSASSQQPRSFSTLRTLWAKDRPRSTEGLQPKILNESPPSKEEESEDVRKHNEELEGRSERAHEGVTSADAEGDKISLNKLQDDGEANTKDGPKDKKV